MDFNFPTEYDYLSQSFKRGISSLLSFSSFLKVLHKQSDQFCTITKKSLDSLISEVLKEDNTQTTYSLHFIQFYSSFTQYLKQINTYNNKLSTELIEPLNQFIKHLSSKQNESLYQLKEIMNSTLNQKKRYETAKNNYFTSCQLSQEQEKKVIASLDNKEKNTGSDKDVEEAHDILYQMRSVAEDNYLKYKEEHRITNALYEDMNSKYTPCVERMKDIEESRETFIKFHFEKMNQIFQSKVVIKGNLVKSLTEKSIEIKPEEDMRIFKEKTHYLIKENIRLASEEMMNYDIYRRNTDALIKKNTLLLQQEQASDITSSSSTDAFMNKSSNTNSKYSFNKEEIDLLDSFFLPTTNDINSESIIYSQLNRKLQLDKIYAKNLIDFLLENYHSKELLLKIPNERNYHLFTSLLLSVISNKTLQSDLFEINFALIYICEKTCLENIENPFHKIYLCKSIANKSNLYHSRNNWEKLLILKIQTTIITKAKAQLKKLLMTEKKSEENTSQSLGTSILSSAFSLGKSLIISSKKDEELKHHQELLDKIYNQMQTEEAFNITRDFIQHFSYFNLDANDSVDIITTISLKFNFANQKDKIQYLLALINSNMYSVKNSKIDIIKKYTIDDESILSLNISLSNRKEVNDIFMNRNYFNKTKIKDFKIIIVLNAMKYLNGGDYVNILCLNKACLKIISRILYRNILIQSKSQGIGIHIGIWKKLLHCSCKSEGSESYQNQIEQLKEIKSDMFDLIQMDVHRTLFPDDIEENQVKLKRILSILVMNNPIISYSQGMNYIAAFLLYYTQNEEEAYNIFNGLLKSTDYGNLFANELHHLRKYFYVFDRLIFIYMPEVFAYLKYHNVSVAYYISPWFITLFTNAFQYMTKSYNNPKVFTWIFDLFILDGWKAIIKIGLCLMKHFEKKILHLKYEELLHFLVNDMLKCDFFQMVNFDRLNRFYCTLKLESGLIDNLENEYQIKMRLDKEHSTMK